VLLVAGGDWRFVGI
jgi:hypothetical protein